jgi:hypothetical protein
MGKNMETAKERVLSAYPRLPKGGKIERKQEVLLKITFAAYCFMKSMKYESLVGMQPGSYYAAGH